MFWALSKMFIRQLRSAQLVALPIIVAVCRLAQSNSQRPSSFPERFPYFISGESIFDVSFNMAGSIISSCSYTMLGFFRFSMSFLGLDTEYDFQKRSPTQILAEKIVYLVTY